jgi:hypothetical protein
MRIGGSPSLEEIVKFEQYFNGLEVAGQEQPGSNILHAILQAAGSVIGLLSTGSQ